MLGINLNQRQPIYEQLVESIENMVLNEVLEPNEPLPSIRELAAELTVNPNTIQKAYAQLESHKITYSIPGKGSFVSADIGTVRHLKKQELLHKMTNTTYELIKFGANKQELIQAIEDAYQQKEGQHDKN